MDLNRKRKNKTKEIKNEEDGDINFEHINAEKDFETVTFDFLEPDLTFASNIYSLLQKTFSFFNGDTYNLVELICKQQEFGIFLSVQEDETGQESKEIEMEMEKSKDIYALLSIIKLASMDSLSFTNEIQKTICNQCSPENLPKILKLFDGQCELGLLVNERVINLPYLVVPSVYDELMKDREFISNCPDYTPEELQCYSYQYLVYFIKSQDLLSKDTVTENQTSNKINEKLFYKQEDKLLIKHALIVEEMKQDKFLDIRVFMVILKYEDFLGLVYSKKMFN